MFQLKFENGKFFYKEGASGWVVLPKNLLFSSICVELIALSDEDLEKFVSDVDVNVGVFVEYVLKVYDTHGGEYIGDGLKSIWMSKSRWKNLLTRPTVEMLDKYFKRILASYYSPIFSKWYIINKDIDYNGFLSDLVRYFDFHLNDLTPDVVEDLKVVKDDGDWFDLIRLVKKYFAKLDEVMMDFMNEWIIEESEEAHDEWLDRKAESNPRFRKGLSFEMTEDAGSGEEFFVFTYPGGMDELSIDSPTTDDFYRMFVRMVTYFNKSLLSEIANIIYRKRRYILEEIDLKEITNPGRITESGNFNIALIVLKGYLDGIRDIIGDDDFDDIIEDVSGVNLSTIDLKLRFMLERDGVDIGDVDDDIVKEFKDAVLYLWHEELGAIEEDNVDFWGDEYEKGGTNIDAFKNLFPGMGEVYPIMYSLHNKMNDFVSELNFDELDFRTFLHELRDWYVLNYDSYLVLGREAINNHIITTAREYYDDWRLRDYVISTYGKSKTKSAKSNPSEKLEDKTPFQERLEEVKEFYSDLEVTSDMEEDESDAVATVLKWIDDIDDRDDVKKYKLKTVGKMVGLLGKIKRYSDMSEKVLDMRKARATFIEFNEKMNYIKNPKDEDVDVDPKDLADGMFYCKECGHNHRQSSKTGYNHRMYGLGITSNYYKMEGSDWIWAIPAMSRIAAKNTAKQALGKEPEKIEKIDIDDEVLQESLRKISDKVKDGIAKHAGVTKSDFFIYNPRIDYPSLDDPLVYMGGAGEIVLSDGTKIEPDGYIMSHVSNRTIWIIPESRLGDDYDDSAKAMIPEDAINDYELFNNEEYNAVTKVSISLPGSEKRWEDLGEVKSEIYTSDKEGLGEDQKYIHHHKEDDLPRLYKHDEVYVIAGGAMKITNWVYD